MSIVIKITNKLKRAQYKTETQQNNLYFTRKDTGPLYRKSR